MMCGGLKAEDCTFKHWFDYIGRSTEEDGVSPFRVNFHITSETLVQVGNNTYQPTDQSYVKCSQPISNESEAVRINTVQILVVKMIISYQYNAIMSQFMRKNTL